jgi:cold shock CspA family protein
MQGKIKACNSKGYGFIETDKNIDFYFHYTEFKGDWKILLKKYVSNEVINVEFDNDPNAPSGPRATNVRIV